MKTLLYIAPITNGAIASGYSTASEGMLEIFKKMQVEGLLLTDVYNNPYNLLPNNKHYDFCFVNANPNMINNTRCLNQYRELKQRCNKMFLSIVWEAEPYPEIWNTLFNAEIFDGYLCPSLFIKNLLKNKIKKPLFYYPHFIDISIYSGIEIENKLKQDSFVVSTCGQLTERKSFDETIVAFSNSLGDNNDCKLIIKTNRLGEKEEDIDNRIRRLSLSNGSTEAAIYSMKDQNISLDEMINFYHETSLFVLPSKGEGFGLNIYEALSCGINCLYSDFSSFSQLRKNKNLSSYTKHIEGNIDLVKNMHQYGYQKNSKWFYPSIKDLSDKMKYSYESWKKNKEDYFTQGLKNRQYIINNFSYEPIKRTILNIFEGKEVFYG